MKMAFKLLPLLVIYLIFVCWHSKTGFQWDEGTYIICAQNLTHGFYASTESLYLWNGPGYPFLLYPFALLHIPWFWAKILNAFLLYGAAYYFGLASAIYVTPRKALIFAFVLGIYLCLHGSLMEFIMPECLSVFLVSGICFHGIKVCKKDLSASPNWIQHFLTLSFYLGYLALTKVFFGYTLLFGFLLMGFIGMVLKRIAFRRFAIAQLLGLLICLPYLGYTYKLTGKIFYWGNSGGQQVYCMTLPEKKYLGDWLNFDAVIGYPDFFCELQPLFKELSTMNCLERDARFKQVAKKNIKNHPQKYFQNWRANINRMVFGYPISNYPNADTDLTTGNRSLIYAAIFFMWFFGVCRVIIARHKVSAEMMALTFFAGISLTGLSLLSAIPRQVFPLVPILALGLVYVWEKLGPVPISTD